MKILYVTTISRTMNFFSKLIEQLVKDKHTVELACNDKIAEIPEIYRKLGCQSYSVSTSRSPLSRGNLTAIRQIKAVVESNHYDIVHCHTPIAAFCTRLACRKARKKGTRVFYTAHGFHFYKGAPKKNWLLYYPLEKLCARFTDVLITINREDYAFAQRKLRAKEVRYVPGVGIDLEKFQNIEIDKAAKRQELGVPEDGVLLLMIGELNDNKNQATAIRALAQLQGQNVYCVIAGRGAKQEALQKLIDVLGMQERIRLLGFRKDIGELCKTADALVFPSYREGLPVSVMEAMANSLPVVCSRIRGNVDLIDEPKEGGEGGGFFFDPNSVEACKEAIQKLLSADRKALGSYNAEKIKAFEVGRIIETMKELYQL